MAVHLIANPAARSGRSGDRIETARSRLSSQADIEFHLPSSAAESRELLGDLAASGVERVVVAGGDGMIHMAVNELAGSSTVLGIVAAGTGNDAATGLGLSKKVEDACTAALGPAEPIDLIAADDRYAITVAIVGVAVAINERAESLAWPKGAAKYSVATLAELPRLERHELTVTIDGVDHDMATNLLAVANLAYFGGGMRVAPDADPSDGMLEVVAMGPANPLTFGTLLPTVFAGRHVRSRHVTVLRGREVSISGADLRLRADGEAWGSLPVTMRAAPGALLVAGVSPNR